MESKPYDFLKFVALVVLPAFGTLYFTIADLWALHIAATQVVGSITAFDTFLGVFVHVNSVSHKKAVDASSETS